MTALAAQTADMLQLLPDEDIVPIHSLVKRLLRTWDPDFVKLTDDERKQLETSENEIANGEYFTEDEVWQ